MVQDFVCLYTHTCSLLSLTWTGGGAHTREVVGQRAEVRRESKPAGQRLLPVESLSGEGSPASVSLGKSTSGREGRARRALRSLCVRPQDPVHSQNLGRRCPGAPAGPENLTDPGRPAAASPGSSARREPLRANPRAPMAGAGPQGWALSAGGSALLSGTRNPGRLWSRGLQQVEGTAQDARDDAGQRAAQNDGSGQ